MLYRLNLLTLTKFNRFFLQSVQEKLDTIVSDERSALKSAYSSVMTTVSKTTANILRNQPESRKFILNQCVDLLSSGPGSKAKGANVLAQTYSLALSYVRFEMELKRVVGYTLTEEQRLRIYRSVQSVMRIEGGDNFVLSPMDTLVPAKQKLPMYTRKIA